MVETYGALYLRARRALQPVYGEQAGTVARELLSAASGKRAEEILADRELYARQEVCTRLDEYLARAVQGEPLAYILGQWDFAGMTLTVTPDTLIPRDDTMAVTELAVSKALFLEQAPRILDLCTGTGCIGLAIARRVKDARLVLGDISPAAVRVAKKNAQELRLGGRVSCLTVDALAPAAKFLGVFDLIVSNPPYVTSGEMAELEPSVRLYEPSLALDGGPDGLTFYRAILRNFTPALRPGGYLCFEFGMGQEHSVCALLQESDYEICELQKDLRGVVRAVLAQRRGEK